MGNCRKNNVSNYYSVYQSNFNNPSFSYIIDPANNNKSPIFRTNKFSHKNTITNCRKTTFPTITASINPTSTIHPSLTSSILPTTTKIPSFAPTNSPTKTQLPTATLFLLQKYVTMVMVMRLIPTTQKGKQLNVGKIRKTCKITVLRISSVRYAGKNVLYAYQQFLPQIQPATQKYVIMVMVMRLIPSTQKGNKLSVGKIRKTCKITVLRISSVRYAGKNVLYAYQ